MAAVARNVLGLPLKTCCLSPKTGWFRDGSCRTDAHDHGRHLVCAQVTNEFLQFSLLRGNDLMTPRPGFPGLKPGDKWCLCVLRWSEAFEHGVAPPVVLEATHENALIKTVSLDQLRSVAEPFVPCAGDC